MAIKSKYRYIVEIAGNQTVVTDTVLFGDNANIKGTQPDGEYFHRETMGATIGFSGKTFVELAALSRSTEWFFVVERFDSGAWVERWRGRTIRTKGRWLEDQKRVDVKFDSVDRYTLIEEGKSKRFNLIDLGPELVNITYERQGLIQIYVEGTDFISNYLGDGVYFESALPEPVFTGVGNDLENTYHFQFHTNMYYIPDDGSLSPSIGGLYDTGTNLRADGVYRIIIGSPYQIEEVSSGTIVYQSDVGTSLSLPDPWEPLTDGVLTRATFTSLTDAGSITRVYSVPIYVRLLTNQATVQATATNALPSPDIDPDNTAYTRALPLTITDTNLIYSSLNSVDGDKYGRFDEDAIPYTDNYFNRPPNVGSEEPQPIGKSDWQPFSLWFVKDATLRTLQDDAGETLTNRNSYTYASVIEKVVQKLDPSMTFQADSLHSQFLYDPANPVRGITQVPIVSVKNDVIVGDYDTPAKKADVSLEDLLNQMWITWRCKYFIDSSNRFRIEHNSFYENGKSYVSEQIGADLTSLTNKENGRFWSDFTNQIEYDEDKVPERIEFRWMDEVTLPFEGFPIDFTSAYVQKGNVQKPNVALFTTDLDYIQANAGEINKQGFVLFEADQVDARNFTVPFLNIIVDGTSYQLQNGHASMFYIHSKYYQSRLPAEDAMINNVAVTGISTERIKLQNVEVPAVFTDFMQLVTTSQGNGLIPEYEENILSGFLKLNLKHGF